MFSPPEDGLARGCACERARVCLCVCKREKERNNRGEDARCSRTGESLAEAHVGLAGLGLAGRRRPRSERSERGGACEPGARSGGAVRAAGAGARARERAAERGRARGAEGRGCGSGAGSQTSDSQSDTPPSFPRQKLRFPGVCGTRWGLESSPEKMPLH